MKMLKDRIAAAMRRHPGLSQAEIAKASGVSSPSVSDWLSGKTRTLKNEPARRAAALFGCDQNWLATGIGQPQWRDEPPLPSPQAAGPKQLDAQEIVRVLSGMLIEMDATSRDQVEPILKQLAIAPDSVILQRRLVSLLSQSKRSIAA